MKRFFLLTIGFWLVFGWVSAQDAETRKTVRKAETRASGVVRDAQTGAPLPFVNIFFVGTQTGSISGSDGRFSLGNSGGNTTLGFQSMGYKAQTITLKRGQENASLDIKMEPDVIQLQTVDIKPPKRKEKYTRKGNPAVELIRNVIAHKDSNRVENLPAYKANLGEKRVLALQNDSFNFQKKAFARQFSSVEKYVDSSEWNGKYLLPVSLKENLGSYYYKRSPRTVKRFIEAESSQGLEDILSESNIWKDLEEILPMVNLCDNDITLVLNKFMSPLSSAGAVGFYRFYILDTVVIDGDSCVDLAFVPVSSESCGFTGHLFIPSDGTYVVRRAVLDVPAHINLNFINNIRIQQDFERLADGLWALKQTDTYLTLYLFEKKHQLYGQLTCRFDNYDFSITEKDTVFSMAGDVFRPAQMPPIPAEYREERMDSLMREMNKVSSYRHTVNAIRVFESTFIPTTRDANQSKFDLGPFWSFLSWNKLEGVRLRIGGMTTGNLHPHWFLSWHVAAGTNDWIDYTKRFNAAVGAAHGLKYNVTVTYSFPERKYHPYEPERDFLSLSTEFETYEPGRLYTYMDKDHILNNIPIGKVPSRYMQYIRLTRLSYNKEWRNHLRLNTWVNHEINEAAGLLKYERYAADRRVKLEVDNFHAMEYGLELRYAPNEPGFNKRLDRDQFFNQSTDALVLKVGHRVGLFDYKHLYNFTEIELDYRIWMSSFGHIDITLFTGVQWNRVSFPKLYLPHGNPGILMRHKAFNMLQPMEFISDKYAVLFLTYHMKGLILNRIPGINRLNLREVVSFCMYSGHLSNKNNPELSPDGGLYLLPEAAHPMGTGAVYKGLDDRIPYMEFTVGIENIFKFIRIDYVRRINYLEDLSAWGKNGVSISFLLTI